jgi:hypothetical protein
MLTKGQLTDAHAARTTVHLPGRNTQHLISCAAVSGKTDTLKACTTDQADTMRRCSKCLKGTPARTAPTAPIKAAHCAGSGTQGPRFKEHYARRSGGPCPKYDVCPECGKEASIMGGGVMRQHMPKR